MIEFRVPKREEYDALVQLGKSTGIFNDGEEQELLGQTLLNLWDKNLPPGHEAWVLEEDTVKAWAYFGPENNHYNLYWIGVDPKYQGKGYGKSLLQFVEKILQSKTRVLIIETSSSDLLKKSREFYKKQGYQISNIEPNFYGKDENKLVFKKTIKLQIE